MPAQRVSGKPAARISAIALARSRPSSSGFSGSPSASATAATIRAPSSVSTYTSAP
jgi:hypothetical protein